MPACRMVPFQGLRVLLFEHCRRSLFLHSKGSQGLLFLVILPLFEAGFKALEINV